MTEHTRTSGSAAFSAQGSVVSNGHPQITDDELLATPLDRFGLAAVIPALGSFVWILLNPAPDRRRP